MLAIHLIDTFGGTQRVSGADRHAIPPTIERVGDRGALRERGDLAVKLSVRVCARCDFAGARQLVGLISETVELLQQHRRN